MLYGSRFRCWFRSFVYLSEDHGVQEDIVACEDGRLRWHVDAHGQRLRRDHDRETLHSEEPLHRLAVLLRQTYHISLSFLFFISFISIK
jgi:hypothetical protein